MPNYAIRPTLATVAFSGRQQAVPRRQANELADRVHGQLLHDARAMGLDGLDADEQLLGDDRVARAAHDEIEDLALAGRQLREHALAGLGGALVEKLGANFRR